MISSIGECLLFTLNAGSNFWSLYQQEERPPSLTTAQWDDLTLVGDQAAEEGGTLLSEVGKICETWFSGQGEKAALVTKRGFLVANFYGRLELTVGSVRSSLWIVIDESAGELFLGVFTQNSLHRRRLRSTWSSLQVQPGSELKHAALSNGWRNTLIAPSLKFTTLTSADDINRFVDKTLTQLFGDQQWKHAFD